MKNNIKFRRKFLLIAAFVSSMIYIGWRILFTVPTEHGVISLIAGIALVAAEGIGVIEAFSHSRNLSASNLLEKPEIPVDLYPHVDVFIATHSESTELLYKTVNGCIHMKYPDPNKVHVYICDDNDRPEMKQLAEKMGVGYLGLSGNKHAKAGNLNNALSKTDSPLVATFDADMIPTHDFLMETVPYFFLPLFKKDENDNWVKLREEEIDKDYKIGFIQTPQSFYNADLFQFNLFAEKNIPNEQDYFFREINVGRNRTNSAIYAGSNTLISRTALDEVGGITTGTITEDFATGIKIQSKGYKCFAIPRVLAHGLSPSDFKSLIKQRQRWGRGCVQTLRKKDFFFGKLPFKSKLSYISCFLYWGTFLRRFIYIISPILFTVFGVVVVEASLLELILIWLPSYIIYNQALKVLSGNIRNQKWSNIVDTIIFPYMIIPIMAETLGIKLKKFFVTPKTSTISNNSNLRYAIPHFMLIFATLVGLWASIRNMILYRYIGNVVLIYWLLVNLYFLVMAIFFMLGRINYRSEERFYAEVPVKIEVSDRVFEAVTCDISENGMAILLSSPEYLPYDTDMNITISYLDYESTFTGKIVHVTKQKRNWKYSIKITNITEENKRAYFQIVFDRDHTLPNTLKSDVVKDFTVNIQKRAETPIISNRKLPRIPLNTKVNTIDGSEVTILNFNYEYVLLESEKPLMDFIQLDLGNDLILKCHPKNNSDSQGKVLCEIENWKEIAADDRLKSVLSNESDSPDNCRSSI